MLLLTTILIIFLFCLKPWVGLNISVEEEGASSLEDSEDEDEDRITSISPPPDDTKCRLTHAYSHHHLHIDIICIFTSFAHSFNSFITIQFMWNFRDQK